MKVGQNSIVRWVAKIVAKGAKAPARQVRQVRTLDADQLRQISGGDGGSTQLPYKGW
jgi:hypothetical protein